MTHSWSWWPRHCLAWQDAPGPPRLFPLTDPRSAFSPRSPASLRGECMPNPSSGHKDDVEKILGVRAVSLIHPDNGRPFTYSVTSAPPSSNTILRDTQDHRQDHAFILSPIAHMVPQYQYYMYVCVSTPTHMYQHLYYHPAALSTKKS